MVGRDILPALRWKQRLVRVELSLQDNFLVFSSSKALPASRHSSRPNRRRNSGLVGHVRALTRTRRLPDLTTFIMSSVIFFDDFDASKVLYNVPKRTAAGGLSVYINYDKDGKSPNGRLHIQTPRMRAPFGISCFEGKNQPAKYTIQLSFDDYTVKGTDNEKFYAAWTRFDETNKETSHERSPLWFNKKMTRDLIDAFYTSAIKPTNKPELGYPPTFKCSIPFRNNKFECAFFDERRNPATGFDVPKGCEMQVIFEVSRMWFMDKNFGCTPVVKSVQFFTNDRLGDGYNFLERLPKSLCDGDDECDQDGPM